MSRISNSEENKEKQIEKFLSDEYSFSALDDVYKEMEEEEKKYFQEIPIDLLDEAPKEWNFYPKMTPEEFLELIDSIIINGLLNPIRVWEKEDGRYMILIGHNRVRAYKKILELGIGSNSNKYMYISAYIYGKDEIDEKKAKELILDENKVQREKDKFVRDMEVIKKKEILTERGFSGNYKKKLAEATGLSEWKVQSSLTFARLHPKVQQLVKSGRVSIREANKFYKYPLEMQEWIVDTFGNNLNSYYVNKLKRGIETKEDIVRIFAEAEQELNLEYKRKKEEQRLKDKYKEKDIDFKRVSLIVPTELERNIYDLVFSFINEQVK